MSAKILLAPIITAGCMISSTPANRRDTNTRHSKCYRREARMVPVRPRVRPPWLAAQERLKRIL